MVAGLQQRGGDDEQRRGGARGDEQVGGVEAVRGDQLAQLGQAAVVAVLEQELADVGVDPESASRRSLNELSARLLAIVP